MVPTTSALIILMAIQRDTFRTALLDQLPKSALLISRYSPALISFGALRATGLSAMSQL